jgi:hypothetical protein
MVIEDFFWNSLKRIAPISLIANLTIFIGIVIILILSIVTIHDNLIYGKGLSNVEVWVDWKYVSSLNWIYIYIYICGLKTWLRMNEMESVSWLH